MIPIQLKSNYFKQSLLKKTAQIKLLTYRIEIAVKELKHFDIKRILALFLYFFVFVFLR